MSPRLYTEWGCWEDDCDAGETSTDWHATDKAAEKHVKQTGHPTWCRTRYRNEPNHG